MDMPHRPPGPEKDEAATLAGAAASISETQEILRFKHSDSDTTDQAQECDFDWSRNKSDVIIREQPRTAIYRNPWGAVVIRQMAGPLDDDDTFVWIDVAHLGALIDRLQEIKAEAWG